jgi:FKBP-type peptidyl-prolyl cis-trans isomerase SlyD
LLLADSRNTQLNVSEAGLAIAADVHVTINYAIFEIGAKEPTPGAEKLTDSFVHGYGQVLPALEQGLVGHHSGEHLSLEAEPDDAFGAYEADGVFELDKDGLDGADTLVAGEEFMASGPQGDILMRVVEVKPDSLVVDTNHPLAGKRIRFEIDVVEVRAATEEEIEEAQEEMDADDHHDHSGCGHDHSHDGHGHSHDHGAGNLVSLRRSK